MKHQSCSMQLRKLSLYQQISFRRLPQSRVLFIDACDAAVTIKGECHLHLLLLGREKFPSPLCTVLFLTAEAWRRTYTTQLARTREEAGASARFLLHPGGFARTAVLPGYLQYHLWGEEHTCKSHFTAGRTSEHADNGSWTYFYIFMLLIELLL